MKQNVNLTLFLVAVAPKVYTSNFGNDHRDQIGNTKYLCQNSPQGPQP